MVAASRRTGPTRDHNVPTPQNATIAGNIASRLRDVKWAGGQAFAGHRFHDLPHTYASYLYRASGNNLRMVQTQLGHQSIRTTEIHADVLDGETEKAVNPLYR